MGARVIAALGIAAALSGCSEAGKRALLMGGFTAAESYLAESPRIRQELTLAAMLATDAVLIFEGYQTARAILEAETGRPVEIVSVEGDVQ